MKFNSYNMLAKANIKRGKKSNTIFILLIISVILLTIVLTFSFTLSKIMDKYINNERARRFMINSWTLNENTTIINQQVLNEISKIDHIISIDKLDNMDYQFFRINNIVDKNNNDCNNLLSCTNEKSQAEVRSLYESEKINVVIGKTLNNTPVFSCIVPDQICLSENYNSEETTKDFAKGSDYLDKTLTIKPLGNTYEYIETVGNSDFYSTEWRYLPALEYTLKVVGVYSTADIPYGGPNNIFVSYETGKEILSQAIIASVGQDEYEKEVKNHQNNIGLNNYEIVVDKYKNIKNVQEQLENKNINYSPITEYTPSESFTFFCSMFTGAANFLIGAMLLLTIINIFLSVLNNIMERKSEIGLLKAVGYTNRQVFFTMYLEQLKIGLRAFAIGFTVSGITVLIMNYINATGPFVQRKYIVDLTTFVTLGGVALLLVVLVPLICQLIALKRLANITPKQAMSQR